MCLMKCAPLPQLLRAVYPDLYPLHALHAPPAPPSPPAPPAVDDLPRLQLTAERCVAATAAVYICTRAHAHNHGRAQLYLHIDSHIHSTLAYLYLYIHMYTRARTQAWTCSNYTRTYTHTYIDTYSFIRIYLYTRARTRAWTCFILLVHTLTLAHLYVHMQLYAIIFMRTVESRSVYLKTRRFESTRGRMDFSINYVYKRIMI